MDRGEIIRDTILLTLAERYEYDRNSVCDTAPANHGFARGP